MGADSFVVYYGVRFQITESGVSDERLAAVMADTQQRLKEGGFAEAPGLLFHFEVDF